MFPSVPVPDTGSGRFDRPRTMIHEEIRHLIALPTSGPTAASLATMEHTLTAGYAEALALEAERWRLERRVAEVAALLGDGDGDRTDELAGLGRRLSATDRELTALRGL